MIFASYITIADILIILVVYNFFNGFIYFLIVNLLYYHSFDYKLFIMI